MAYTNFQHCTEEEYTNIIYSQDAKNKIKILFNNVELTNADRYCEKLTRKERILPDDSSKRFSLDNFVSQEIELILHDVDSSVIKDQVSISIGTLVDENNDVYEYVPLGIFNIQDTPTTDKNKITVKLRDNRVKFDFNYNGKELIDAHDGSATKLQILQDICDKAGVQTTITSFAGDSDLIGIYDNTITATTYISYLAEQAGAIAKIDREGKLIFTYLTDSKDTTIAGSGSISDSFNGGLISTQIEGKAEQHSYSGKNYVNTNKDPDWKYGNTVWERSGSNVTVKNNGTSTYAFVEYYVDNLKPNTVYTVSMDAVANENGYIRLSIGSPRNTGGTTSVRTLNTSGKQAHLTGQFTTPSDTSNLCVMLYSVTGTYHANARTTYSNIQIEEGSSETSYEPFTNNLPAPNPYYPEEIKTVSGIGNLLGLKDTEERTITGLTTSVNNNIITLNGTTTTAGRFKIADLIDSITFDSNKTYILSVNILNGNVSSTHFNVQLRDESSNVVNSIYSNLPYTFTGNDLTALSFNFYIAANNMFNNLQVQFQIEESSTPHQYVPYGHWLPVKVSNKNLFDNDILLNATDWSKNEDGYYTGTALNLYNYLRSNPITGFKENTQYTVSNVSYGSISNGNGRLQVKYTDGTNVNVPLARATTEHYYTYTTSANKTIDNITFNYSNAYDVYIKYIQIEEGTTATEYIEHQEQTTLIDLNKYDENNNIIGNYEICSTLNGAIKDTLAFENGVAKITKNISRYVLNGSETWNSSTRTTYLRCNTTALDSTAKTSQGNRVMSNYFTGTADIGTINGIRIGSGSYMTSIFLDINEFATVNAFKTWLSTHNTEVYYQLATPETIILRGTYDINLYEGVNHISIEDELEPTMNITYSIEKTPKRIPLSIVEKYELGTPFKIERIVYEDALRKYQTSDDSEKQTLYINSANPYISSQLQIDNISARTKNFIIDSVNTGKILGNPALDSYDLIEVYDDYSQETTKPIIFRTLANNNLTYNGVLISEYDTQIGLEERTENVTINGEATFKKWAKTQIDNVESNVSIQTGRVDSLEDGMKNVYTIEQVNKLVQDAERGVTNTFTKAGGNNIFRNTGLWFAQNNSNNPYEFWSGNVSRVKEDKAYNKNALSLQNSTLSQEQSIPNGDYTVSFIYKKLINLANVIVRINGVEYTLDSTEDKEFEKNIIVSSQNIKIEFISDTANSCKIYDLMVNAGTVKLAYSQNQNETTTDTVNISKGITITSSDLDVKFKADADGIRTLDSNNTELTKFTDVGMTTKEAIIQSKSQIVGTLWQEVREQTWITRL